jgi:hypothetical protein
MGRDATAPAEVHDVGQTSGSGRPNPARLTVRLFRVSVGRSAELKGPSTVECADLICDPRGRGRAAMSAAAAEPDASSGES